jgi:hypothetical protein
MGAVLGTGHSAPAPRARNSEKNFKFERMTQRGLTPEKPDEILNEVD